jgi:hypothetical protein
LYRERSSISLCEPPGQNLHGDFGIKGISLPGALSIPPITAGRDDCGESIEVEIDDDLDGSAGGIVA